MDYAIKGDTGPGFKRRKLLVLDLDGTVRRSKSGKEFIQGPDDIEIIPGTEEVLWQYAADDWLICGVTNQGGVAYGIRSMEQIQDELRAMAKLWDKGDPFQGRIQFCPFHPKGKETPFKMDSLCRKPHYGMLVLTEAMLYQRGILADWPNSMMVGDRMEDFQCAMAAGIDFKWAEEFFLRGVHKDETDLLTPLANSGGFGSASEMRTMLEQLDIADPIHFRELVLWRDNDGTKDGLTALLSRLKGGRA